MQVFSRAGDVKRIIMGLDKNQLTPCGFAFVVYYTREDAEDAVKYISGTAPCHHHAPWAQEHGLQPPAALPAPGTIMDDRPVRVDFDWGFKEGRQYGRGRSGGQVRRAVIRHAPACSGCACQTPLSWERQVRDEYRTDWDAGRGGYGNIVKQELAARQDAIKVQMGMYAAGQGDAAGDEADAEDAGA